MEVCIKYREECTVSIENFISFYVGMVNGDIFGLLECDAIEFIGQTEYTFDDVGKFEIGAQHLGIEIIFAQF